MPFSYISHGYPIIVIVYLRSLIPRSTAIASASESTFRSPGTRVSAVVLPDADDAASHK